MYVHHTTFFFFLYNFIKKNNIGLYHIIHYVMQCSFLSLHVILIKVNLHGIMSWVHSLLQNECWDQVHLFLLNSSYVYNQRCFVFSCITSAPTRQRTLLSLSRAIVCVCLFCKPNKHVISCIIKNCSNTYSVAESVWNVYEK